MTRLLWEAERNRRAVRPFSLTVPRSRIPLIYLDPQNESPSLLIDNPKS